MVELREARLEIEDDPPITVELLTDMVNGEGIGESKTLAGLGAMQDKIGGAVGGILNGGGVLLQGNTEGIVLHQGHGLNPASLDLLPSHHSRTHFRGLCGNPYPRPNGPDRAKQGMANVWEIMQFSNLSKGKSIRRCESGGVGDGTRRFSL
ncbi:hypothetical protein GOP47_0024437 [Adiantum capillus-veneris]|uniref:Uncharacterized protein n=1 Tax=Adiantum capillus-veneris TaxID=13818 RepID=A0A9D4U2A4_ADICA|nr:hypothetical protein GOP47_0024437 [Adiantum capillus-veneris]